MIHFCQMIFCLWSKLPDDSSTSVSRDGVGADGCLWVLQGEAGAGACLSRRRAFQAWLSQQSELLSSILNSRPSPQSPQELAVQQDTLKVTVASV